ncbi:hypothetical protein [Chelatococcus asaccharovorans]|uniref:Uncharacterized protein n=1 Tax=Chelatococcus asaccharovorans TaxID=28210 RepID=A0A2V3U504_9HYPH|nr:hypothetical protein [Chelatococcus asaccharovorans]MBS7702681.1 hypothetical protein [Chelatococcus asaccharovorans]PXW56976.1 hypothetical protein C7450_10713 [Chelatococcus asaccharovorans]
MGPVFVTIYMPLLEEGTEVWRPVPAEHLGRDMYRIAGPRPVNENWKFEVGAVITARQREFRDGSRGLVAEAIKPDAQPDNHE